MFVEVASTRDLMNCEKIRAKAGKENIMIANLNGKYYAIGNICTHAGCELSDGEIKNNTIECPCHGSVFDIKTGKVMEGPAKKPEPVHKIKVEGQKIFVDV